jgi:hypothetical protein
MSLVYIDMLHTYKVVSAKPDCFMPSVKKKNIGAKIAHFLRFFFTQCIKNIGFVRNIRYEHRTCTSTCEFS